MHHHFIGNNKTTENERFEKVPQIPERPIIKVTQFVPSPSKRDKYIRVCSNNQLSGIKIKQIGKK